MTTTKVRLTKEQRKALETYEFAERQEDRYLGSVFVTPIGQRQYEEKTKAAYEACKRLGMGVEHGL
jgi:cell division protein FtsN